MAIIYETENFSVETKPLAFVSREEGGHIRIFAKRKITDRTKLTPKEAIELMRLSMVVGEAMEIGMNKQGVKVIKINYEDLGNWAFKRGETPQLHIQVFGRTWDAKIQKFPDAVNLPDPSTGFYDNFEPLNDEDIAVIREEIERVFKEDRFQDENWRI